MFSESFLDEVRNRISITEVVGQFVTWDREKSIPAKDDLWANCPFHGENTPSFHADGKKGIYHCFGCGVSGDHFKFLTESQGKSFPEAVKYVAELAGVPLPDEGRPERTEPQADSAPKRTKEIVATYDYTDRDGNLLYQVVRMRDQDGKKSFFQRRPDGRGGWINNLEGLTHTIWRHHLIEIAIAEGKTIFLPEGEKDVQTLEAWGLVATTNSGGAKNWTPELAKLFAGADVVVLGDDDEAGRARVEAVCASLKPIAKSVRAIRSWNGPKDVTDWRDDAGGTLERLQTGIGKLQDWRPIMPASKLGSYHVSQMATSTIVYDWLVKGLIERQGAFMVAGEEQSGKSFFLIDLGMKVARGVDYGKGEKARKVKQGLVIYMAREDPLGILMRVEGYRRENGLLNQDVPFVVLGTDLNAEKRFTLMDDDSVDEFIEDCLGLERYYGINLELIVIDTYSASTEGMDEIKTTETGKVQARVNRIIARTGATVGLAHHLNAEGNRIRGNTSITANHISQVIELRPLLKNPNNRKAVVPEYVHDAQGRLIRRAFLKKNKNGANRIGWNFILRTIKLGVDSDGDDITTCVLDAPAGDSTSDGGGRRLQGDQKLVFDALIASIEDEPVDLPAGVRTSIPRGTSEKAFAAHVRKVMTFKAPDTEPDKRNDELAGFLKRNVTALMNAGWMGRDTDLKVVWSLGREDRPRPKSAEPAPPLPDDVRSELKPGEAPF